MALFALTTLCFVPLGQYVGTSESPPVGLLEGQSQRIEAGPLSKRLGSRLDAAREITVRPAVNLDQQRVEPASAARRTMARTESGARAWSAPPKDPGWREGGGRPSRSEHRGGPPLPNRARRPGGACQRQ